MELEFLVSQPVKTVLFTLRLGDKFERDLIKSIGAIVSKPEAEFGRLRDALVESGLVYRLRGDAGSHYLSLTDVGQAVADGLFEVESMLAGKHMQNSGERGRGSKKRSQD